MESVETSGEEGEEMSIELIEITQEMHQVSKRIDKASKEIFKLAKNKAEFEKVYREALAKEIVALRAEGVQATLIPDLARGKVAYLKFERDLAKDMFKSGISALEAVKTQASVLQTISKYQEVL
jgi:septal ring factor EnvC (AmiA/AmiB activator)